MIKELSFFPELVYNTYEVRDMTKNNYLDILLDDQPELRESSSPISVPLSKDDDKLIKDMMRYVKDSINEDKAEAFGLKPSVGLAAPQVGVNKQMIAIYIETYDDEDNKSVIQHALINPKIISHSEQEAYLTSGEGCLSVEDDHPGYVYRKARVTVEAYDALKEENVTIRARGLEAMVLQHEIDHLHGILFYDHIDPNAPHAIKHGAIAI